ncbi:MAG: nuclear transport factor 2 family protein [Polaribacter sp.]
MIKKVFFFLLFFTCLASCKITDKKLGKDTLEIKKEINIFLNNWHKAASESNYKNYFKAMDSVSVFAGTAAQENWTKKQFAAFSKPYFDNGKAWNFKTLERNIYISSSKNVVWFDELLDTWMGTCRGSGVLEKNNNLWKIKQYVLSVSIPNEDIKAVIATKKKNDSIFLKKYQK